MFSLHLGILSRRRRSRPDDDETGGAAMPSFAYEPPRVELGSSTGYIVPSTIPLTGTVVVVAVVVVAVFWSTFTANSCNDRQQQEHNMKR